MEHLDGVVDERYIEESGDTAYRAGQRPVVKPEFVLSCCKLTSKLAAEINRAIEEAADLAQDDTSEEKS